MVELGKLLVYIAHPYRFHQYRSILKAVRLRYEPMNMPYFPQLRAGTNSSIHDGVWSPQSRDNKPSNNYNYCTDGS